MLLKIIVLVLLSVACLANLEKNKPHKPKHDCEHVKNNLTNANNNFLRCVMNYNVNATFCLDCRSDYNETFYHYEKLMDSMDTKTNKTCREIYVDNNQLNVVEMIFSNAKKMWDHGFCSGKKNIKYKILK